MQKVSSAFEEIVNGQKVAEEKDQSYAAATDGGIGEVEDGAKKDIAAQEGHPVGPSEEREIEHIDHTAGEKSTIALAEGSEMSHLVQAPAALAEDEAVKEIVNDIAGSSCHHGSPTHQQTPRGTFPDDVEKRIGEKCHSYDAEERKYHCADILHAKRHTFVFGEANAAPVGHLYLFAKGHIGLDGNLDDLIDDEDADDDGNGRERSVAVVGGQRHSWVKARVNA